MEDKFKSPRANLAYKQLQPDYDNFHVFNSDRKNFHNQTIQGVASRKNCIKYLERIIANKTILEWDVKPEIELLTKIMGE